MIEIRGTTNPQSHVVFQEFKRNKLRVQAPASNNFLNFHQPNLNRERLKLMH
jgi:hypothetical protein